jgi:hypothetical protein
VKRLAALAALVLAACAPQMANRADGPRLRLAANPSAVIAAEIGFNRLAQEKGQWTAFRETAAKGAEMFVPDRVMAESWLKGRTDPPVAVKWQPSDVWSSCEGTYAVTRGVWQRPGSTGSFATVWQRQKDGRYKWLLDMSLADETTAASPDTVNATVADCLRGQEQKPPVAPASNAATLLQSKSDDGTLTWQAHVTDGGARQFTLWISKDGAMREVLGARLRTPGRE